MSPTTTTEQLELWQKIQSFPLDDPGSPFPFSAKLAKENHWPLAFAHRAIEEYRRFVFLSMAAGHVVCPSEQVDQVWHLHLTCTQSYWHDFCRDALGKPLHHHPSKGGRDEDHKHVEMYERSLESYRTFFGEPPADLWPDPFQRFGPDTKYRRINTGEFWVLRKAPLKRVAVAASALVLLVSPGVFAGIEANRLLNPFDLRGPAFLLFFTSATLTGLVLAGVLRWSLRKPADEPPRNMPPLHPYEIAYLTGGPVLATNTALASMSERTLLRPRVGDRAVETHSPLPDDAHPFERAIYDAIPKGHRPLSELRKDLRHATDALADRLRLLGLLPTRQQTFLAYTIPLLVTLIAPTMGLIKVYVGMARNRPVAYLIIALLIAIPLGLVVSVRTIRRSRRGDKVLKQLRARHARLQFAQPTMAGNDLALAMGLFGFGVLAHTQHDDLRKAFQPPQNSSGCGGGCGTSSGGDGGGGSGCGGGGCGGCGGGGD